MMSSNGCCNILIRDGACAQWGEEGELTDGMVDALGGGPMTAVGQAGGQMQLGYGKALDAVDEWVLSVRLLQALSAAGGAVQTGRQPGLPAPLQAAAPWGGLLGEAGAVRVLGALAAAGSRSQVRAQY